MCQCKPCVAGPPLLPPRFIIGTRPRKIQCRNLLGRALIANPNRGFRVGPIGSYTTFNANHSLDDAERAMRRDIAQLAWHRHDGTEPPEVIQHNGDLREFQDWVRWQIAFRAAKDDGASDDEARAAASNRDESHDAEVLNTAGPTP